MRVQMRVKIRLLTELLGTVAMDKKLFETYTASKKPETVTEDESINIDNANKIELQGWTGFMKDENGLFIYEYMIKGFLKDAGNVLKDILKIKGLRSKINNYVFIAPRRIYLGQQEPDDVLERPLRGMTPQGPIVTLVRSDLIKAGKEIEFEITLLQHKEVKEETLKTLLEHGLLMGLGQWRNGGYGRFEVIEYS